QAGTDNQRVEVRVPAGKARLPLRFRVTRRVPSVATADLVVTDLTPVAPASADPAEARMSAVGAHESKDRVVRMPLDAEWFNAVLHLNGLRAGPTYTGQIRLFSSDTTQAWTVTAHARPLGTIEIAVLPPI